jgi:hypothetical protein
MTTWEWIQLYLTLTLFGLVDALSPVRIAIILVLLSGARPLFRSAVFILGVVTVSFVLAMFLDGTMRLLPTRTNQFSAAGTILDLLLGVGLLLIAIHTWYQHPAAEPEPQETKSTTFKLPNFVQRLADRILNGNVLVVYVGGIVMQIFSVKSLILLGAALREITQWPITSPENIFAIVYYVALSTIGMSALVIAFAAQPENSTRMLTQVSSWLLRSTYRVLALVEGMLAFYLFLQVARDLFTLYRS